ncbi:ERVV2 protein, partial [Centropus bengalensis]|nr:ERVV2 protein [Centropus bengalensis]NXX99757.1 ERVV2 protein [Centropus bengalensis]
GSHSFVRWYQPSLGMSEPEKAVVNISAVMTAFTNATTDPIQALQGEVHQLSEVVIQNRMALDMILASHGGVCEAVNTSCCSYVDEGGRIARDLE